MATRTRRGVGRHDRNGLSMSLGNGPEAAAEARRAIGKLRADLDPPLMETLRLLVTELVTNSAKHAHPDGQTGRVWVGLTRGNGKAARITVRDDGVGLPTDFEMGRGTGLGMRLAMALAQQTDAVIRANRLVSGTEFVIEVPLAPSS